MTIEDFNDLMLRLKRGDNSALAYLHPYQDSCIRMLVTKSGARCDQDQAYDIFVECILDFWKNVLRDKVLYQNIPAYLRRMCWNKWLAFVRTKQREESKLEDVKASLYDTPDAQTNETMEQLYNVRLTMISEAMEQLSTQCRNVLYMAIAEELSMAEIAARMEMASSDVAKTTKSRCYKKLIEVIRNSQKP